jgi:hypothetical protein
MYQQPITKDILVFDKYEIHIKELINHKRFTNAVEVRQLTPKARFRPYKILYNYGFNNYEKALDYAKKTEKEMKDRIKDRQERKQRIALENKNVNASDFYEIGDIIVNSWGYEQTNVSFYQVVGITKRTIKTKQISQEMVEGSGNSNGMACEVMPKKDAFIVDGKEYKHIVNKDGYLSQPESYYHFHKWEGKPEYKSWYY